MSLIEDMGQRTTKKRSLAPPLPSHLKLGPLEVLGSSRNLLLIGGVLLSAAFLAAADYYDWPSYLLVKTREWSHRIERTFDPIVVTDADIFAQVRDELELPEAPLEGEAAQDAWRRYRDYRLGLAEDSALVGGADLADRLQSLQREFPAQAQQVIAEADRYAEDRFNPFGSGEVILSRDFTWTSYPSARDDLIYVYEVNTLQHLTFVAQALVLTGDRKYAETITRHMQSWSEQNPIDNSPNWATAMEPAIRLSTLVWVEAFSLHDSESEAYYPELIKAIYGNARFLVDKIDNPRKFNNHGIFAAVGLYLFAASFPEFDDSAKWKAFAEERIQEEGRLQYSASGAHQELTPFYHLALLDSFLQFAAVKNRLDGNLPDELTQLIRKQKDFLQTVSGPDGAIAQFRDSDDHHFIRLPVDDYRSATPSAYAASLLTGAPWCGTTTPAASWEADLLLGGAANVEGPECSGEVLRAHQEDGFVQARLSGVSLIANFARLGAEPKFSGHSHSDMTSFVMWKGDQPILLDPGVYSYRTALAEDGVVWRDFLRSAAAHNLTTVDGKTFAEPIGDFGYDGWPDARLLTAQEAGDELVLIAGAHAAYGPEVGRAVRVIAMSGTTTLVADWFPDAEGAHEYQTGFLLATQEGRVTGSTLEKPDLRISWTQAGAPEGVFSSGDLSPPGGWYSPAYGTRTPVGQLRVSRRSEGTTAFGFLIEADPASSAASSIEANPTAQGGFVIEVRRSDGSILAVSLLPPASAVGLFENPATELISLEERGPDGAVRRLSYP